MSIELLHIDCMEYMVGLPDGAIELAIVDPPYGININMNMGLRKGKKKKHAKNEWDKCPPEDAYFMELFRISKNQIIWGGNYFNLPLTKAWIFWDKLVPDGVDFADGELAWTSFNKTLTKVTINYSGFRGMDYVIRIHPTQKPIALYKWLLKNYANPGDKILDTHGGSMSSAIACHQMGFDMVLCEIDKDYYDAGCKRFKEQTMQLPINY